VEKKAEGEMNNTLLNAGTIDRGDITLRDIVAPWFRHKRLLAVSFCIVALASVLAAFTISDTYEAHMQVFVNRERVDPAVTSEATSQVVVRESEVTEEEINSEAELLKSQDVLEKVVLETGLEKNKNRPFWRRLFVKQDESRDVPLAVQRLGQKLKIETPIKTNLINVSYSSDDSHTAFNVLNSLATLYVQKHVAVHRPAGSYAFFEKEADKYRSALADSEARLANFGNEQGVVAPDIERSNLALIVANSIASLHQAEQTVAADEERIRDDKSQMGKSPERSLGQRTSAAADALLQQLEASLLAARVKRTELLLKFEPTYPLVKEADQEIADTEAAIAEANTKEYVTQVMDRDPTFELLREDVAKARSDLAAQRATVVALKQSIKDIQLQMVDLDQKAIKQADLLRDNKTNEDNYLLYSSKREQERASDALDQKRIANVAIAVPAVIPVLPLASLSTVLVIGFVLALAGGAAATYVAEFLDPSLRTPRDVIDSLGIPIVVSVPEGCFGEASS
jgi:uncharacterized protein involved in exopolysaccharide biosynthesis